MKIKFCLYLIIFLFLSCASPKKHYQKGNYKKAFSTALKDLKSGKKERQLKSILNKSFQRLIDEDQQLYNDLLTSDMLEDWELAYSGRNELLQMYDEGERYLDNDYDEPIQIARTDHAELEKDIVLGYIELGDVSMDVYRESGDKYSAQEAFLLYQSADRYGYSNSIDDMTLRLEDSYTAGTIVIRIDVDSWDSRYRWDIERRFEELEEESETFFLIVYDEYVENPDCEIEIDFGQLYTNTNERRTTQNYSEEVEDGYTTRVDTSGNTVRVPNYAQVTGSLISIEEIRTYNWEVRVDVNRLSNYCKLRSDRFNVSDQVIITNYETTGDIRAIPSQYTNQGQTTFSRNDEDRLIENLIDTAYDIVREDFF